MLPNGVDLHTFKLDPESKCSVGVTHFRNPRTVTSAPPYRGLQSITKLGRDSLGAGVPGGFPRKKTIFEGINPRFFVFYVFLLKFLSLFPPCTRGKLQFPCTFPSWEAAGVSKDRPPTQNLTTNLPHESHGGCRCDPGLLEPRRDRPRLGTPPRPPGHKYFPAGQWPPGVAGRPIPIPVGCRHPVWYQCEGFGWFPSRLGVSGRSSNSFPTSETRLARPTHKKFFANRSAISAGGTTRSPKLKREPCKPLPYDQSEVN